MKTKKELRKEILQLRDSLTEEERQIKSHQITEQILGMEEFVEANKVLLFASYKSEVGTLEIFEEAQRLSKDIYYPRVIGKEMEFYYVQRKEDLIEGYRGICEPKADKQKVFRLLPFDKIFILMPGIAFDKNGNRIGYGGGYYDKFIQKLEDETVKENLIKIGVAFECQIVEEEQIAREEHDMLLDCIVTERQIIKI